MKQEELSTSSIQTLERRIRKLERQLRVKLVLLFTIGVIFVSAWTWQSKPDQIETLRARRIILVDDKGTERIYIGSPVPDPMVAGKRTKRRVPSTGIIINDAGGNETGGWGFFDDGSQVLCFDDRGVERLCLAQYPGARGGLVLKDERGRFRLLLGRINDDAPRLVLSDSGGTAQLRMDDTGAPRLELFDEKGRSLFIAPAQKNSKKRAK